MKGSIRYLILAFLPLVLGIGMYAALNAWLHPVPLLVFRVDLGITLLLIGGGTSLVLLMGLLGWELAGQRGSERLLAVRRAQEDARRRFIRRLDHELKNPLTGLRAALANLGAMDGVPQTDLDRSFDQTAPSAIGLGPGIGSPGRKTGDAAQYILPDSHPSRNSVPFLHDAVLQTERLSRLIADLRKLAELEERPLDLDQVNLAEVLEENVAALCGLPQYTRRAVNLVIPRVPWPLPSVNGDRDLLGLAFYNLVENALKYSGPADAVEVRAVDDGRWVIVEVADSGPGIASDDLPRIFEELYRGANARGKEGSGLGLSLVRRVIDRHGGDISVRSSQSGQKGTVFRVRLKRLGS
jgi:two-component system, OmpR family, sensor kinase